MQQTQNINKRNPNAKYLAKAGWQLCQSLLWNNQQFSEAEIEMAQELIELYISKKANHAQRFIAFCERVQLAKNYLETNPTRFVPHPLKWLSPFFEHGFYGTKAWYLDMVQERKYIPIHRFELRVFAEAYLQYVLEPCKETYQISKKALAHYNNQDMMQVFNNTIINFNYN
jgi:replication-associated recombination protein RarA